PPRRPYRSELLFLGQSLALPAVRLGSRLFRLEVPPSAAPPSLVAEHRGTILSGLARAASCPLQGPPAADPGHRPDLPGLSGLLHRPDRHQLDGRLLPAEHPRLGIGARGAPGATRGLLRASPALAARREPSRRTRYFPDAFQHLLATK